MAYQTGGAGGVLVDLMDALRTFALGLGWTVDKWDNVNRLLFMRKGICTVTMKGDLTRQVAIYSGANGSGVFANTDDHRLYMAMGTGNDGALNTYHSHPGSPVTADYDNDAPFVNGLNGPYVAWFFFADPTVSDHIHCVVQISAEVFMHFSMGFLDKRGLTHNGVAYVTGTPNLYYRNVSNWLGGGGGRMNDPAAQSIPFAACSGNSAFQPATYDGSPSIILKNSNAWPAAWLGAVASANGVNPNFGLMQRLINQSVINRPESWPLSTGGVGCLLDCVVQAEAAPYSNIVPLFPVPVLRYHYDSSVGANSRRICYVGDFPNVRLCNMSNILPGAEIDVGGETFKVFPAVRRAAWTDSLLFAQPTSGQFAVAYKKVA